MAPQIINTINKASSFKKPCQIFMTKKDFNGKKQTLLELKEENLEKEDLLSPTP